MHFAQFMEYLNVNMHKKVGCEVENIYYYKSEFVVLISRDLML